MNFLKKVLISISIVVLLFGFAFPKRVQADSDEVFSILMKPIMSFFVGIGDGIMSIMQKIVLGMDESLIDIDNSSNFWIKFWSVVAIVALCAAAVVATVLTGGTAAAIVGVTIKAIAIAVTGITITLNTPIVTGLVKGMLPNDVCLPLYTLTPENIFSNKIPMLDVDFFSPNDYSDVANRDLTDKNDISNISIAYKLRSTIANWYIIIRNIAIVASLSILVYLGIRILISSSAEDKSKYKQILTDWLVSLCLIFCMHYIMAFSNIIVKNITDAIDVDAVTDKNTEQNALNCYYIADSKDRIKNAYKALVSQPAEKANKEEKDMFYYHYFVDTEIDENGGVTITKNDAGDKANTLIWPVKNFLQQARMEAQINRDKGEDDSYSASFVTIGWKLIYCILVVYTVIFMWTYLKRVVYMAFLTIIAPFVAMTYPLDKINDGKAQAFDMWFKEYIFNLLIQPMHLLLYTILVSSAFEFVSKNIIYVIVCLGFIFPAEKIIRKFFGFNKADTPGILGGPAGAALMMTGMKKIFHGPPPPPFHGKNGEKNENNLSSGENNGGKLRTSASLDALAESEDGSGSGVSPNLNQSTTRGNGDDLDSGDNGQMPNGQTENDSNDGEYSADVLDVDGNVVGQTMARDVTDNANQSADNADFYSPAVIDDESDSDQFADFYSPVVIDNNDDSGLSVNSNATSTNRPNGTKSKKGKISGYFAGNLAATGKAIRYAGAKLKQPGAKGYAKAIGKTAGRIAFRTTATAIGATGGAIAGITSGDPAKFAQYTLLGASAAYEQAKATHLPNWKPDPELQKAMGRAKAEARGQDYDELMKQKKIKELKNDPKFRTRLENHIGEKGAEDVMKNHWDNYTSNGLYDADSMATAYKIQQRDSSIDDKTAVATTRTSMAFNDLRNTSTDVDKSKKRFAGSIGESTDSDRFKKYWGIVESANADYYDFKSK